jgi:hypothetical protein
MVAVNYKLLYKRHGVFACGLNEFKHRVQTIMYITSLCLPLLVKKMIVTGQLLN